MKKLIKDDVKPFNEIILKSCYYNQLVIGYNILGIPEYWIAGNYFPLYEYNNKKPKILNVELFTEKELFELTGIKREYYNEILNMKDFIINEIDQNHVVIIPVDTYSLSYRLDTFNTVHYLHYILVYGYDTEKNNLYITDHFYMNDFVYKSRQVPFESIIDAYHGYFKSHGVYIKTMVLKKCNEKSNKEFSYFNILNCHSSLLNKNMSDMKLIFGYLKDCFKDLEITKKERETIISFFEEAKIYKNVQSNILKYILDNKKIVESTKTIVDNYRFLYSVNIKAKLTEVYSEKLLFNCIRKLEEIEKNEKLINDILLGKTL